MAPGSKLPKPPSRWLAALFGWYARRYLTRHFHSVRVARAGADLVVPDGPMIVALNHPGWWDPLVAMMLARAWRGRVHVAAMDRAALSRYPLFERLGFFGVEPASATGLRELQRIGRALLMRPNTALWLTPQGQFQDIRKRPLGLRPGIGLLTRELRQGCVVPVALEYAFWSERLPEALVRVGKPILVDDGRQHSARGWTTQIEERLAQTQDELAALAMARDAAPFESLVQGKAGVGLAYDLWRRLRAWQAGSEFQPEHGEATRRLISSPTTDRRARDESPGVAVRARS